MKIDQGWRTAIDKYLAAERSAGQLPNTLASKRERLEHLARRVTTGPWSLTADDYIDYTSAQDWARETRRQRQTTVAAFYDWAVRKKLVSSNPTEELSKIKAGDPNPSPVPDGVYLSALIRADEDEQLWIDLAAEHGLRRGEIALIHSDDLVPTLLGWDLRVHGKGAKIRWVPLTSTMARTLQDRIAERGEGYLFPGKDHGHVSARWLGERVSRLMPHPWTLHKLRHRAATRFWVVSGFDAYAVAELMGWASINMVPVYVAQPTDRLRSIVNAASRAHRPHDAPKVPTIGQSISASTFG